MTNQELDLLTALKEIGLAQLDVLNVIAISAVHVLPKEAMDEILPAFERIPNSDELRGKG